MSNGNKKVSFVMKTGLHSIIRNRAIIAASAIGLAALSVHSSHAATVTDNMNVQLIIQASCEFGTVNDLDFGTATTPLTANIDADTTLEVVCTNGTTYEVGLNAGTTAGGTIATRKMFNAGTTEDVDYQLFQDAGRTTNWGNDTAGGTDTVSGTGNGATQTLTVYGRVMPQTTPTPATYTDVITVTVEY